MQREVGRETKRDDCKRLVIVAHGVKLLLDIDHDARTEPYQKCDERFVLVAASIAKLGVNEWLRCGDKVRKRYRKIHDLDVRLLAADEPNEETSASFVRRNHVEKRNPRCRLLHSLPTAG